MSDRRFSMNALPTDIYIKMFEDGDIKEKIRILSTSRSIRDAIYSVYGGNEIVDELIQREKKMYMIRKILSVFNKKQPDTIDFTVILRLMNEYNIHPTELRDPVTGKTILMFACMFAAEDDARDLVEYILLETGDVDYSEADKKGMTALMYACAGYKLPRIEKYRTNPEIVDALLEYGSDLGQTDNNGRTAIEHANTQSALDVLERYDADEQAVLDARIILSNEYEDEDFDY